MEPDDFQLIDRWIRAGSLSRAQTALKSLAPPKPREPELLLRYAELCRRAGIPLQALKALQGWVRPGSRRAQVVSPPRARIEYAASLLRLGAHREALRWLAPISSAESPDKRLFEAFALFAQWEDQRAVAPLAEYCSDPRVQGYALLVGRANLCAALVQSRHEPAAEEQCRLALEQAREGGHAFLAGNILTVLARLRVFQGRRAEAREVIAQEEFRRLLTPGPEGLLFRKWQAIVHEQLGGVDGLERLAREAEQAGAWEIARDCEFHAARISGSQQLMGRLYWGSPFTAYRQRVLDLGYRPSTEFFDWPAGGGGADSGSGGGSGGGSKRIELDTRSGLVRGKPHRWLKPGSLGLQLLKTLALDAYRPRSLIELHEELYPGEHFDPDSTPDRLHQLLRRTRQSIAASSCVIVERRGLYRLQGGSVRVGREALEQDASTGDEGRTRALIARLGQEASYSLEQIAELGSLSLRTASRRMAHAERLGLVRREGKTRGARYRR